MPPTLLDRIAATRAPAATILIRPMVGGVFVAEGVQKFVSPAEVGAGRFARIGLPLLAVMLAALVTTKLPILLRTDLAMTLGALFPLVVGAGPPSLDARRRARTPSGGPRR